MYTYLLYMYMHAQVYVHVHVRIIYACVYVSHTNAKILRSALTNTYMYGFCNRYMYMYMCDDTYCTCTCTVCVHVNEGQVQSMKRLIMSGPTEPPEFLINSIITHEL